MIQPVKFLRVMAVTAAVSCACLVSAAAASMGVGTVQADALRLRSAASTDSAILATASEGDAVIVLEDAGNNWYKVDYESVQGYMSGEYLTISQKADAAIGYGKVNAGGSSLNMRSAPPPLPPRSPPWPTALLSRSSVWTAAGIRSITTARPAMSAAIT